MTILFAFNQSIYVLLQYYLYQIALLSVKENRQTMRSRSFLTRFFGQDQNPQNNRKIPEKLLCKA